MDHVTTTNTRQVVTITTALSNTGGFSSIIFIFGAFLMSGIQEAAFFIDIIKENLLIEED